MLTFEGDIPQTPEFSTNRSFPGVTAEVLADSGLTSSLNVGTPPITPSTTGICFPSAREIEDMSESQTSLIFGGY